MSEVTRILKAIDAGDPHAAAQLLPLVYEELRRLAAQRLARESPGQTLEATALVHDAYLRLVGDGRGQPWDGRGHFFAAAAGEAVSNAARGSAAVTIVSTRFAVQLVWRDRSAEVVQGRNGCRGRRSRRSRDRLTAPPGAAPASVRRREGNEP
jgi:ECF sigma factor